MVNLKAPKPIKLWPLQTTKAEILRQCDEKLLRNSVALMKEMLEKKEVEKIKWVNTDDMLADVLTKRGGNSSIIKEVVTRNTVLTGCDDTKR